MPIRKEATEESTIRVEIGTLGGEMRSFVVPRGTTVTDLLEKAGYPTDSEVRCNGETYNDGDELVDRDSLIVVAGAKVRGGK
jgi:hypothetical protein